MVTMAITRDLIVATLSEYLDRHPGEQPGLGDLLAVLDTDGDPWSRANLPGGHLDSGDASPLTGALRELEEETGISWQSPGDASATSSRSKSTCTLYPPAQPKASQTTGTPTSVTPSEFAKLRSGSSSTRSTTTPGEIRPTCPRPAWLPSSAA